MPCQQHLVQVQGVIEEIRAMGADVAVVTFAKPGALDDFGEYLGLSFPLLSDQSRRAYRTYGLEEGSFLQIWHPKVVLAYVKYALQGKKIRPPRRGDDLDQLGGDFVIDAKGHLTYVHRSLRPDDRPQAEELVRALRRAAAPPRPEGEGKPALETGPSAGADGAGFHDHAAMSAEQNRKALARLPQGRPFLTFLFSFLSSQGPLRQRLARFLSLAWKRADLARKDNPDRCRSFWGWWTGIVGLGLAFYLGLARGFRVSSLLVWAGWLLPATLWAWMHLGLVHEETESGAGRIPSRFGFANALTFARLALAPLAWFALGTESRGGWVAALLIAGLAFSDLADGFWARGFGIPSRFGRIADPMADVALMTWLGLGMARVGLLPDYLGLALLLRYPGLFVFVFFWTFLVRPLDIRSTWFGKGVTAASSLWLAAWSALFLLAPGSMPQAWLAATAWTLTGLIALNLGIMLRSWKGDLRRDP